MIEATARILRADSVKVEGRLSLELEQTHPQLPRATNAASVQPQVRILENHQDFAVIEITCSCGSKTNLRCEYAAESTPGAAQTQGAATPAANSPNTPSESSPPADEVKEQTK